jgi:hypothetical protein
MAVIFPVLTVKNSEIKFKFVCGFFELNSGELFCSTMYNPLWGWLAFLSCSVG